MPSLSTQKRRQRTCHDCPDRKATSSRISPKKTCRPHRKLERDRDRNFADFDRPIQMSRLLQVPVGLVARKGRTRAIGAALPRATEYRAATRHKRRSAAEPCPLWSIGPFAINVLPLKAQVKHRVTRPPTPQYLFKLEITFCVRGVRGPPCGVPSTLGLSSPFSITPAFRNARISFTSRLSSTRLAIRAISLS